MSACKECEEPLFLSVEDEEIGNEKVPDDLALSCGCHFHWYVTSVQRVPPPDLETVPALLRGSPNVLMGSKLT